MDIVLLGLVIGMANALLAAGLVLIHMSNRVINMAHGEFGAFAVAMMLALTRVAHLNYWLALALSLLATAALGAVVERTFLKRLFDSPRLILLIATIGLAQVLIVVRLLLPKPTVAGERLLIGGGQLFPVPFTMEPVVFDRVVLYPQHFTALIIGPLVAVALAVFLRRSRYGVALRAASENASRAQLLGIPVQRVSTVAWVLAAVMAGIGGILLAPVIGFSATEAVGLPILMRGLAAATIARMASVWAAFGIGLGLGVVDQLVFFWTGRSGLTDVILVVIILAALLARRARTRRTVAAEESSWEAIEPVRPLPAEILAHPRWQVLTRTAAVTGAVALVGAPLMARSAGTFFLASVLVIASVVVSMTVLTGWAGQLSLGQWALAGIGGVLGPKLVVEVGLPFLPAMALAAAIGGLVALLIGLPALRLEGTGLAVVTLGFAVASGSWLYTRGWFTAPGGRFPTPSWLTTDRFYWIALLYLAGAMLVLHRLSRSTTGLDIVAVRDNPRQASAYGVSVVRTKLTAFVVSGIVAAGGGFLWAAGTGLADVTAFPPIRSFAIIAAAVIGGLGTLSGAVIGAVYLWGVPYYMGSVSPYVGLLATGAGLLALLMFLPGGLARAMFRGRDHLARLVTGTDPRPGVPTNEEPQMLTPGIEVEPALAEVAG
ncbi:MAG TPA: ABC transporter permease [Nitriliruptorales bacterium]